MWGHLFGFIASVKAVSESWEYHFWLWCRSSKRGNLDLGRGAIWNSEAFRRTANILHKPVNLYKAWKGLQSGNRKQLCQLSDLFGPVWDISCKFAYLNGAVNYNIIHISEWSFLGKFLKEQWSAWKKSFHAVILCKCYFFHQIVTGFCCKEKKKRTNTIKYKLHSFCSTWRSVIEFTYSCRTWRHSSI